MTDEQEEIEALREMHASARRNIARTVRAIRRSNAAWLVADDIDVEMWHDEVDDWDSVNQHDHRADACRRNAEARRPAPSYYVSSVDSDRFTLSVAPDDRSER